MYEWRLGESTLKKTWKSIPNRLNKRHSTISNMSEGEEEGVIVCDTMEKFEQKLSTILGIPLGEMESMRQQARDLETN